MNIRVKEKLVLKKKVKIFISKILILIIITLIGMIITKNNPTLKSEIKSKILENNISFIKMKKIYQKYFGNIFSIDKNLEKTNQVFNEKIAYKEKQEIENGVELTLSNNYIIPNLESGVIIYIGKKENIDEITVEQIDGVETTYSNINLNNFKLYDYIEKGEYIGEANNNTLYLYFRKDGKYIDYKEYI